MDVEERKKMLFNGVMDLDDSAEGQRGDIKR